ncbi:hypothetical protein CVIRNUC_002064 [Coccomyxa viridis]|uniref:FAS1 domain-containing protein n=1 Tax=Coccomyxa viridis TaxID=1274662 RepID=A0AAV1HV49_9CHLO|nr:hypothetical protein CVIRNUC_002064 [Coccomyxa viridis]
MLSQFAGHAHPAIPRSAFSVTPLFGKLKTLEMARILLCIVAALCLGAASAERKLLQPGRLTVTQTAQGNPDLSTLVSALQKSGLAVGLNDPNFVGTVFAPTNAAFTALEANLGYTPAQLLADPILTPILKYHVVPDVAAQASSLTDNQTLTTMLPGQNLTVYVKGPGRIVITGVQNSANVTQPDIRADKAIIHVVDTVLLASKDSLNANAVDLSAPAPAPMPMPAAQLAAKPGAAPAKPMSG